MGVYWASYFHIPCEGYAVVYFLKSFGLFDLFTFKKVVTDDHWKKPLFQDEERTEAQKVTARRWSSGKRSRPRPLSDYGQLAIRSFSIPEDSIAVESQTADSVDDGSEPASPSVDSATCAVASQRGHKRRPISVIGGVSFYENNQTEEIEDLLTQVRSKMHSKDSSSSLLIIFKLENSGHLSFFFLLLSIHHQILFFKKHEIQLTNTTR